MRLKERLKKVSKGALMNLFPIFALATTITAASILTLFAPKVLEDKTNKLEEYKIQFFQIADGIFAQQDSLRDSSKSLRTIFSSIDRESEGALLKYGFINTLEDYLTYIRKNEGKESGWRKNILCNKVMEMIEKETEMEPFSKLPDEQRRILINLSNSIANNDKNLADLNLNELNDVLNINNNKMNDLKRQNSWSIPLSIGSLIATIMLGFWGIVGSFSIKRIIKTMNSTANSSDGEK